MQTPGPSAVHAPPASIDTKPFGATSSVVLTVPCRQLAQMYAQKCGIDVARHFEGLSEIGLHECSATGMRFWRPASLAGDEAFYRDVSEAWPNYYQTDRWEYEPARAAIGAQPGRVLEVGCGRGYFLRSLEPLGHQAVGLELNHDAMASKVTRFEVRDQMVEALAAEQPGSFDAVCSFQVLEHVTDPAGFLYACTAAVRAGGLVIVSTPNYDFPAHRNGEDAFDMPPHHVNHFTEATFLRIAALTGLDVVMTKVQMNYVPRAQVYAAADLPWASRTLRRGLNSALRVVAGLRPVLGHTLLAVLRKPGGLPRPAPTLAAR